VVLHGGVLEMVWRRAKGLGLDGRRVSRIPNAGLSLVRLRSDIAPSPGACQFEVLHWADTQHLAGMPPQPTYHGGNEADEAND
jgi:2,3-bisphosphoglycerate-dependent phosphoglycerate mutase